MKIPRHPRILKQCQKLVADRAAFLYPLTDVRSQKKPGKTCYLYIFINIFLFTKKTGSDKLYSMIYRVMDKIALFAALSVTLFFTNAYPQKPSAKTFFDIGVENSDKMEYSEAIDAFQHAIKLKPDYAEAYYNLGHAYYSLHRYDEALDAYKNAVKLNQKYADAYIALGAIAQMLSKYDEATTALEKAVKLNPGNAEAHYVLGNVYSELNKHEEAANAYKKAVRIKPKFAEARYHLGLSYVQLSKKMMASAKKEYTALRKINKELAMELNNMIEGKKK